MTSHHNQVFIRIIFHNLSQRIREAVSLARLVEAEIVSCYYGIPINTDMGNPTVPSITALGDKRVLPGWWGRIVSSALIRG